MTLTQFFKKDFRKYSGEMAFFLGNGINNHCQTTSSWKKLLIDLAEKHINDTDDFDAILRDTSVTYPEFFDIVQLSSNERDETFDYRSIKRGFKEAFDKWKPQPAHQKWTQAIKKLDRPILTTNYDYLLEKSDAAISEFMRNKQYKKEAFRPIRTRKGRSGFTPFYPWHSYYSDKEVKDVNKEFAIWHLHGFCEYPSSIRLGLSDYMGIVGKARMWFHKAAGNPFHKRKNIEKWVGRNSWLDILLSNHLLLVGIDLGSQETSLRWLLLEREKLFRRYPALRKKTYYVVTKGRDHFPKGKKLLFDKLKIELIEANSYHQIYVTMPKKLVKF